MSFEKLENEKVKYWNLMQIDLASKFFGFKIGDQQLEKWISEYSSLAKKVLDERGDLLEKYINIDTREEAINEFDNLLHIAYENHK